ncbi:MAG: hypothetical protein MZV70_55205 [Desulfobacterales bacterium]|nr:hypothetical protein [Desulfobacterales bacterium]
MEPTTPSSLFDMKISQGDPHEFFHLIFNDNDIRLNVGLVKRKEIERVDLPRR